MIGQLLIPLPAIGAVFGSFWGGFIGRIVGILLAGGGIAIKVLPCVFILISFMFIRSMIHILQNDFSCSFC